MTTGQAIERHVWTDDELLALPDGKFWTLIDGELTSMSPAGAEHGDICAGLLAAVYGHALRRKLGKVYDSSTGFRLDAENCFAADVAFVRKDRLRTLLPDPQKFLQGAPDCAIEVHSPTDTQKATHRKIEHLIRHGTSLVWYVLPHKREVRVYRASFDFETIGSGGVLDGGLVLPGLRIAVRDIFVDPLFD